MKKNLGLRLLIGASRSVGPTEAGDYRLIDIVADRFDAGGRLGERVEKDMVDRMPDRPISPRTALNPNSSRTGTVPGSPDDAVRRTIPVAGDERT